MGLLGSRREKKRASHLNTRESMPDGKQIQAVLDGYIVG